MKKCQSCGASNPDAAKFCLDCGMKLTPSSGDKEPNSNLPPTTTPNTQVPKTVGRISPVPDTVLPNRQSTKVEMGETNISQEFQAFYQSQIRDRRKADIMFVLDCTGSMQGEIDAVREAIVDFADTIASQAVRARVGLIEFRDRLINEEHHVLTFNGEPFTSDPKVFREQVAQLRAKGGGDEPESSLDAIMLALQQPFAPDANKVLVLITDAPPHLPDLETKNIDEVVRKMQEISVNQIYLVMRTQDPRSEVYLKLLEGARGLAFEIGKGEDFRARAEHFKRTLMALGKTISTSTR